MDFSEIFKATRTKTNKLEKPAGNITVDVRESASAEDNNEKQQEENHEHVQWETGFWKRFPWIGALAILTMLVCIAMDGVILGTSNGQYQQQWPAHQQWDMLSEKWKKKTQVAPHVLLAIVNTITNVALAIAIGHGVAIAWWRRVLKGSTIEDLHRSWGFASSVLELLTAGKRFNYIALAALMAKVALIDNVLLQQAVSSVRGYYELNGTQIHLPMVQMLPPAYAGVLSEDEFGLTFAVPQAFSWDLYYMGQNPQKINLGETYSIKDTTGTLYEYNTGCQGLCSGAFAGAGFHWDCGPTEVGNTFDINPVLAERNSQQAQTAEWNAYIDALETNTSAVPPEGGELQRNPILSIEMQYISPNVPAGNASFVYNATNPFINETLPYGTIGMQVLWANLSGPLDAEGFALPNATTCTGNTLKRYCRLRPSVIDYTLEITTVNETDTVSEQLQAASTAGNGIAMGYGPNYLTEEWYNWTDTGPFKNQFNGYVSRPDAFRPSDPAAIESNTRQIYFWLQSEFQSSVNLEWLNTTTFVGYAPNLFASSNSFATSWLEYDPSRYCSMTTPDPTTHIGNTLNNLMIRSSMRAATQWNSTAAQWPGLPLEDAIQKSSTTQQIPSLKYETDWRWGAAAMCIIFLCMLCVLPSYYGFWELGRKVTLGPIEVAGAFQAPIMDHPTVATHGEVDEFVKEIGQRKVRYGQVVGQQRLAVANPTELTKPGKVTPPTSPPPPV